MKQNIQTALQNLAAKPLYDGGIELLNALGYASEKDAKDIDITAKLDKTRAFFDEWSNCTGLFQVTSDELHGVSGGKYGNQWTESFLFTAVELRCDSYSRAKLSAITRELNRAFAMPVIVIFRYGALATIAVIHRRLNKKDENRDVLEKVTLIKDIKLSSPHAAHLRILDTLGAVVQKAKNFVELYNSWQSVLSIQPLNKNFYKRLFELYEELLRLMKYPSNDLESKKDFAVRLIGRLIFIKFLTTKGTLPAGLFEVREDYYHARLEPLFYEQLNVPRDERKASFKDELIPFLNGGLFENHKNDYYDLDEGILFSRYHNAFTMPDDWFANLFAHFDDYVFTVEENTPSEVEVALDPELLGQVFENLLASLNPETETTARKATGSYYTPREIVDYMVCASLLEYLQDKTGIVIKKIEALCFGKTCDFDPTEKTAILQAILSLKIIDPACGSGAFPMGLLHRIVAVLDAIDFDGDSWFRLQNNEFKARHTGRDKNYIRKLSIIQNSIFGVDIQPIACEISKLRFFLSLIIEEEGEPEPLPNLEFKFVCANTLLPFVRKGQQSLIADGYTELEKKLKEIKNDYFTANGHSEKERLKGEFLTVQKALKHEIGMDFDNKLDSYNPFDSTAVAGFFDSEWMFGVTDGFDIVIGNPPYGADIDKKQLEIIRKNLKDTSNSNSAALFIDYGKNRLLKQNGVLSFIVPKSLLYSEAWRLLVKTLIEHTRVIVDVEKAFEKVKLEQVVFVYSAALQSDNYTARKFLDDKFIKTTQIKNDIANKLQAWICDVSEDEIVILSKLRNTISMKEISITRRGVGLQKILKDSGDYPVIGGKNIARFAVNGTKGYLLKKELDSNRNKVDFMQQPKIVSQDLVAHIQNPKPHIKIIACCDIVGNIISVDTVQNTVLTSQEYSLKYITALLNSTFISWYAYKFIFCSAIRTMHFDNYYIGKIPIPKVDKKSQESVEVLVDKILELKKIESGVSVRPELVEGLRGSTSSLRTDEKDNDKACHSALDAESTNSHINEIAILENKIDIMVYELYGLSEDEIKTIEGEK